MARPRRTITKPKSPPESTPNADATANTTSGEGILSLDDYDSEEDEDFDPDALGGGSGGEHGEDGDSDENMDSSSEDEDDEDNLNKLNKTKPKAGEEEGMVGKRGEAGGNARRGRKGAIGKEKEKEEEKEEDQKEEEDGSDDDDEDFGSSAEESEGGEGGHVKTRAQRAKLEREKFPLASLQGATADVDRLWESMNQTQNRQKKGTTAAAEPKKEDITTSTTDTSTATTTVAPIPIESISSIPETSTPSKPGDRTLINGLPHILISQMYTYAGTTTTTTKLVPLDSAEARLFLSSHLPNATSSPTTSTTPQPTTSSAAAPRRRPLKRTSAFDTGPVLASKAKKINTLEKSKLDWAGFVDKEGIKDDLERQGKGGGYIDRQSFLGRAEERREGVWKEGARGERGKQEGV